jgi:Mlc titration factor MtfA (ptsG expression regulator)
VRRYVPLARELPAVHQLRLRKHIQVLLAEVPFIGCAGLVVSDEMRVTIAAQAAFLLLGRGGSFSNCGVLINRPLVCRAAEQPGGVVRRPRRAGWPNWQRGQLIVAWKRCKTGGRSTRWRQCRHA